VEDDGIPIRSHDHRIPALLMRQRIVCVHVECLHALWALGFLSSLLPSRLRANSTQHTGCRPRDPSSFPAPSPAHLKGYSRHWREPAPSHRSSNGPRLPRVFRPLRSSPLPHQESLWLLCTNEVGSKLDGWHLCNHIASRSCVMEWNDKSFLRS
jgi:hypothetical protein